MSASTNGQATKPEFMSVEQVCEATGLSARFIFRAYSSGDLVVHRMGRRILVSRNDLNDWISRSRVEGDKKSQAAGEMAAKAAALREERSTLLDRIGEIDAELTAINVRRPGSRGGHDGNLSEFIRLLVASSPNITISDVMHEARKRGFDRKEASVRATFSQIKGRQR